MKIGQYAGLLATVFAGCAFGAWAALKPQVAHAQINNIRTEEYMTIPNGGLQMRNGQGRVIGMIGESGGAGMIALFGPNGKPSVQIFGGSGGEVSLGVTAASSGLEVIGSTGEKAQVITQGGTAMVSAGNESRSTQMMGGRESKFVLSNAQGNPALELQSTVEGAYLRLFGAGKPLVDVSSSSTKGFLRLMAREGETDVALDGAGIMQINRQGQAIFKAPPVATPPSDGRLGL